MEVERYAHHQPYYVMLDPRDETVLVQRAGHILSGFADVLRAGLEEFESMERSCES
ncbi:MAG: hypothetical protein U1E76_04765 [Planctomycetota bacterium]